MMERVFWTALGASSLAAAVTSLWLCTIRCFTAWGQRDMTYFMCFAEGVLISATFR
jgi:hypothetical protein